MKPIETRPVGPKWIVCAAVLLVGGGGGTACAQPDGDEAPAADEYCDGSSLREATVTVEARDGQTVVSVEPDPIRLCVAEEPSVARWGLDDRTGSVEKWEIQGNASKECASAGHRRAPLSFEVARIGGSWLGARSSTRPPAPKDCWVYDVLVEVGGEVIVLDPELDWGPSG